MNPEETKQVEFAILQNVADFCEKTTFGIFWLMAHCLVLFGIRVSFRGMRCKREWFEEAVDADFEGFKFKIPKGYHGNYMAPQPKEKQITHHMNNTFWIVD